MIINEDNFKLTKMLNERKKCSLLSERNNPNAIIKFTLNIQQKQFTKTAQIENA